uniref:Mitochondrial glycoprotein n=1 Tax=Lotus japonicus TaxID=34305 RepID=I3SGA2_LOTJA|nr:unknown [Lotus japonicus]
MASLIRVVRKKISSSCCSSSWAVARTLRVRNGTLGFASRGYAEVAAVKSPFESNILRVLRNEIEYQAEYAPPHQPETKFNSYTVEERPGEQVITLKGRFGDREDIKIEATMFDGYEHITVPGDDSSGADVRLHLSLLVDISKGEGGSELEFVCSAWPDCLDVEKVYILRRGHMPTRPFLGPNFRDLNPKVQEKFREYLDTRGVNDELAAFLHDYMLNKDRIELLQWMDSLKSFVEK